MVFEHNLEPTDKNCTECGSQVELDTESMQYLCRDCNELKSEAEVTD